ncbi:hypothetical protein G6F58_013770 [Rhizopus delemar]|nr:hypothetical protein G6F58_013770 [Rhizopus delemar]
MPDPWSSMTTRDGWNATRTWACRGPYRIALSRRFFSMMVSASSSPAIGSGRTPASGHSTAMSTSRRFAIHRQSPTACSATARQSTEPPKSA